MRIQVMVPAQIDVHVLRMILPVRYDEEDIPNDFPGRTGNQLEMAVEVDTGKILDWPEGRTAKCYMKVTDAGVYRLHDADGNQVGREIADYVPDCIPGDYGDYVDFDIDASGVIANWTRDCTEDDLQEAFFPGDSGD